MYDKLKAILLIGVVLALGFFTWDYAKTIQQNKQLRDSNTTLQEQLKGINDARKTDQNNNDRVYSISKQHEQEIASLTAENQRLQRCIGNGTCGLRVNVIPGTVRVSGDSKSPGANDAATGELDPSARQDYYALRQGISDTETALRTCQKYAAVVLGLNDK